MNTPPPSPQVLHYAQGDAGRPVSRWTVIVLSLTLPGCGSLLLLGKPRVVWASILVMAAGGGWLAYFVVCNLYPRTDLYWTLAGPMSAFSGVVLLASVVRGLVDRRQLIRSGKDPAAPRWMIVWASIVILTLTLITLGFTVLILVSLLFVRWPK